MSQKFTFWDSLLTGHFESLPRQSANGRSKAVFLLRACCAQEDARMERCAKLRVSMPLCRTEPMDYSWRCRLLAQPENLGRDLQEGCLQLVLIVRQDELPGWFGAVVNRTVYGVRNTVH